MPIDFFFLNEDKFFIVTSSWTILIFELKEKSFLINKIELE